MASLLCFVQLLALSKLAYFAFDRKDALGYCVDVAAMMSVLHPTEEHGQSINGGARVHKRLYRS